MGSEYLSLALVLIVIGVILLAAEILIPTGGLLIVAALLFFGVAVGAVVIYGDTLEAALAIGGLTIGLPVIGYALVAAWRKLSLGRALEVEGVDATAIDLPHIAELEQYRGRIGRTVSPMRPSGTVVFDNRRVDAITEGVMLEEGVWVKCIDVRGGTVWVRQLDHPPDLNDISPPPPTPPSASASPPPAPPPPPPPKPDDFDLGFELPPK